MSRITGYQRPHFEVGAPSVLSRMAPSLLRIVSLVAAVALVYFIYKAFEKNSSERAPEDLQADVDVPAVNALKPPATLGLSRDEYIDLFVNTAKEDNCAPNSLETIYEGFLFQGGEKPGELIDCETRFLLFDRLKKERLFEKALQVVSSRRILHADMLIYKSPQNS